MDEPSALIEAYLIACELVIREALFDIPDGEDIHRRHAAGEITFDITLSERARKLTIAVLKADGTLEQTVSLGVPGLPSMPRGAIN